MKHVLKYNSPAKDWNEALPIGNGFLGAMIYGDPITNRFQLNEDSFWYGGPINRNNPKAKENLETLRKLLFEGQTEDAEKLLCEAFVGVPESSRKYQTAGDLCLEFMGDCSSYSDYERFLDIDNSVSEYSFKSHETNFNVKAFASNPGNVICIRISSSKEKSVSLKITLERDGQFDNLCANNNSLIMSGKLGRDGVDFFESLKVKSDGEIIAKDNCLYVTDSSSVTVILSAATSFRHNNPCEYVERTLKYAFDKDFDDLLNEHISDYDSLYKRNSLILSHDYEGLTNELLDSYEDNMKEITELLYAYGKYLLISSSREGSLPANLQGIWNKDFNPPWESKFTININTQMNYWPAEMCNLSECHLPLFDLMKRMYANGTVTAKEMYGCKGFVAHHNTDIWGDTAPVDVWIPGTFWVMGAAWLSTHIWKHYEYTQDIKFLRENFYLMKESALFFDDFLVERDGYLVTAPSVSPENTFILENGHKGCNGIGCTMDNQILKDLFTDCIEATEILQINDGTKEVIEKMLCKLRPTQIGSKGQILEWEKEYEEEEPGHRHISHLYGLHPSSQITPDKTPDLAKAAKVSLEMRLSSGGGHTGWSRAWIINHYAKLWEGDKVYENLKLFVKNSLLPNMFDNHPPFQIDGNFGVCSGISEMFIQSNDDRIVLLPALPKEFDKGSLKGVKCVGNVEVDITWENGKLNSFNLLSYKDKTVNVLYNNKCYVFTLKASEQMHINKNDLQFV